DGHLYRVRADISSRAKNEYPLACDSIGVFEEHLPRGHRDDRERSRFNVAEFAGLVGNHRRSGYRVFGIGSAELRISDAVNFVTGGESANACADGLDYAREI